MRTPFLNRIYRQVDFDRKLIFKFFTVFSLFEYALKKTQYKRSNNGKVEATWDDFARDISLQFHPRRGSQLESSVNYLMTNPTAKQILDANNQLSFEYSVVRPTSITNDVVWLSLVIRRVRNNLFHGGKFGYRRPRDPNLINHSLVILESWAHLHPDVEWELENAR